MFRIDFLTLAASFGAFQGFVLSLIFWIRQRSLTHRILSLLLLATSIRIAKNIFLYLGQLNPDYFSWYDFFRLALSHQYVIGPLLYFYFRARLNADFKWERSFILHFFPYLFALVVSPFLPENTFLYAFFYLSYISMLIYYALCIRSFLLHRRKGQIQGEKWLMALLGIVAVLLALHSPMFFFNFGFGWGGVFYLLALVVVMGTMLLGKEGKRKSEAKYQTSPMEPDRIAGIRQQLEQEMIQHQRYLDPELNLDKLSSLLQVKRHQLSRVINQEFGLSFSDYINAYRLKMARAMLCDPENANLKIAAIAYDAGFNSVPSFNAAFKKVYGTTPSLFKKQQAGVTNPGK